MAKQLLYDVDARQKLTSGMEQLAKAVRATLGPTGKNVILDKSFSGPTSTKDGVTVSREIELADPFENMGAKIINEVATRTNDKVGDGTTTAVVLAEAMMREGRKYVAAGPELLGRILDCGWILECGWIVVAVVEEVSLTLSLRHCTVDEISIDAARVLSKSIAAKESLLGLRLWRE